MEKYRENSEFAEREFRSETPEMATVEKRHDLSKLSDGLVEHPNVYRHWESNEMWNANREKINNYDEKMRIVELESLSCQRSLLEEFHENFDNRNLQRINADIGSNKIEVFDSPFFSVEKLGGRGNYRVLGTRDLADGKISLRDSDDLDRLKHVVSHETVHDLSFQDSWQDVRSKHIEQDDILITETRAVKQSGIEFIERNERIIDGELSEVHESRRNQFLNEGLTEMFTIEDMIKRGESPTFDCYTQEVGWAWAIREKFGIERIAEAYFAGEVGQLEASFNERSDIDDAWNVLNQAIDRYHRDSRLVDKQTVDDLIDQLHDGRTLVKRRIR